jgi:hypothetical protein
MKEEDRRSKEEEEVEVEVGMAKEMMKMINSKLLLMKLL